MKEKKKTIKEWAKGLGYRIIDADGFSKNYWNILKAKMTRKEFDKGFPFCTIEKIKK